MPPTLRSVPSSHKAWISPLAKSSFVSVPCVKNASFPRSFLKYALPMLDKDQVEKLSVCFLFSFLFWFFFKQPGQFSVVIKWDVLHLSLNMLVKNPSCSILFHHLIERVIVMACWVLNFMGDFCQSDYSPCSWSVTLGEGCFHINISFSQHTRGIEVSLFIKWGLLFWIRGLQLNKGNLRRFATCALNFKWAFP